MQSQVSIFAYHYVRNLPASRYPQIKGLLLSEFRNQIAYCRKYYEFVTVEDIINSIYHGEALPKNAALLTFDDGTIDHYTNVFPILQEYNIQGCFFPPARAILNQEVLDVNKIHFLLSVQTDPHKLLEEVFRAVDAARDTYKLPSNEYYIEHFCKPMRFDHKYIGLIKKMLQRELPKPLRSKIVDELFARYVSSDEKAFSEELYMSIDQIRLMQRCGMYVGSHSHDHVWLNSLDSSEQQTQIDLSLEFLKIVGAPTKNWVMCYPHGGYDESVIQILKERDCAFALTTREGIAELTQENAFTLERLDTNVIPKGPNQQANEWTKKVL